MVTYKELIGHLRRNQRLRENMNKKLWDIFVVVVVFFWGGGRLRIRSINELLVYNHQKSKCFKSIKTKLENIYN